MARGAHGDYFIENIVHLIELQALLLDCDQASKAAVAALTVALSEEVVKEGILVDAVAPAIMDTPANRAAMPKADYTAWPKVEEVAATILFLASPENKVTRGAVVPVYGRS
jgi:NAD(P)-dependent dehydrogenase (short-subunit alcohol dehydrogenase family)